MNAQTKMSAKGQVVIPKAVRDRLHWREGDDLEVVETVNGIILRAAGPKSERITIEEFERRVPGHTGASLTLEQMDEAVAREAKRRYEAEYQRPTT